jgi:hypothetical protein
MTVLIRQIVRWGSAIHPVLSVAIIVGLNVYWTVTLDMFGRQFEQVAGALPIDLLNVAGILSAAEAREQIATYRQEAKTLYWSFFVMDNIMPPLVFGSFTLLWVPLLRRHANRIFDQLLNSPFMLIPFGVGFFDWIENLCFVVAITIYPQAGTLTALQIGLGFVWLKAACLFTTFNVTALLIGFNFVAAVRQRFNTAPADAA